MWIWYTRRQLRQVRDPHLADDVVQAVFMVVLRKAEALPGEELIGPWLIKVTRYFHSFEPDAGDCGTAVVHGVVGDAVYAGGDGVGSSGQRGDGVSEEGE